MHGMEYYAAISNDVHILNDDRKIFTTYQKMKMYAKKKHV